jgi:hypothetical protein
MTLQDSRYQHLEALLKAQQWKEADEETYRLMITTVGKRVGQYFTGQELLGFPCKKLRAIDKLWVDYSKGNFGFSVQKNIYVACGGELTNGEYPGDEIWESFGDRVGWRKKGEWLGYKQLDPSFSSPQGNFPAVCLGCWVVGRGVYGGAGGFWFVLSILFRIKTCEL